MALQEKSFRENLQHVYIFEISVLGEVNGFF